MPRLVFRLSCAACALGETPILDLAPEESVVAKWAELCVARGMLPVDSASAPGTNVYVCNEKCAELYRTEVAPFVAGQIAIQKRLAQEAADMKAAQDAAYEEFQAAAKAALEAELAKDNLAKGGESP